MTRYEYAIALGFDGVGVNVQDLISVAPTSQPLPAGSQTIKTLDGKTHVDGAQIAVWNFAALSNADFYVISQYFGAAVTIVTRTGVNASGASTYAAYNAYASYPQPGDGYELQPGGVADLSISFHITSSVGSLLMLEDGSGALLLESGGYLLLES